MTKVAKIFIADGFEETEAVVPCDILLRGGVDVKLVSVNGKAEVEGAHGLRLTVQERLSPEAAEADLLMLPGGMPGTLNLGACEELKDVIARAAEGGKVIAAICAAPSVIGRMGLLRGRRATCYPGFESELAGAVCTGESVVKDGKFITGIGPGASYAFGLALLAELKGDGVADEVRSQMMMR